MFFVLSKRNDDVALKIRALMSERILCNHDNECVVKRCYLPQFHSQLRFILLHFAPRNWRYSKTRRAGQVTHFVDFLPFFLSHKSPLLLCELCWQFLIRENKILNDMSDCFKVQFWQIPPTAYNLMGYGDIIWINEQYDWQTDMRVIVIMYSTRIW